MDLSKKPFLAHIDELFSRLRRSFLWILCSIGVAYFFAADLIDYLKTPVEALLSENIQLVFLTPFEKINLYVRMSFILGIALAAPLVLREISLFLWPALSDKEKRTYRAFIFSTLPVFCLGIVLGYAYLLSPFMKWITEFGSSEQYLTNAKGMISITSFVNTELGFLLLCGITLELPLIMFFMTNLGIVSANFWSQGRKTSIVINSLIAAILSPPDIFSMFMMMLPLILLYECGIFIIRMAKWWQHEKELLSH